MPRNRSAIAALQKLEADREALDSKQRELEVQAARELGEDAAIEKLTGRGATRASNTAPGTQ